MRHVGRAYQEANELELAEKSWLRGAELNPDDTGSRELLCDLYSRQGRLEESLKWVRELKRIAPQNRLHDRNEGLFLSRSQAVRRSRTSVSRTLSTGAHGQCRLRGAGRTAAATRRQRGEAQSLAQRAVEFDPSGPHLFLLAIVAHEAGDLATARQAIEQALAREPENPQYRRLYASISNRN